MNDYIGKMCPFCRTEFKPDDEIVVCSECEMPHHKNCWIQNQGCTTFGCLGTMKAPDNSAISVTVAHMDFDNCSENFEVPKIIYCTKCGSRNSGSAAFCSKCGNRLTAALAIHTAQSPVCVRANTICANPYTCEPKNLNYQPQDNHLYGSACGNYQSCEPVEIDMEIEQLVGDNPEYYVPRFQKLKLQNKKVSWNWSAFLVSPYWLVYRKMYCYGVVVMGITLLTLTVGCGILLFLVFAGYIAIGIYGNYIYLHFLEAKAILAKSMMEPDKTRFIVRNGGVNSTAATVSTVGFVLLIVLLLL